MSSDGQKKQVFIYRLLTANTIDEKIYQRQLTKTGLSEQMMAQGTAKGKETKDCGLGCGPTLTSSILL